MIVVLTIVLSAVQAVFFVIGTMWFVVAALRSRPISRKEHERVDVRSLSWPSDGSTD